MNEYEPVTAALRDTDTSIPPVDPGPLLAHARRLTRRRHRRTAVTSAALALAVGGGSMWLAPRGFGGLAAPIAASPSARVSASPAPVGDGLATFDLASGTKVAMTVAPDDPDAISVWVKNPSTGGVWVQMEQWDTSGQVAVSVHSGYLFGRIAGPPSSVDLRWDGVSHPGHIFTPHGRAGTLFAMDASLSTTGDLPRERVTAVVTEFATGHQRAVELPSGVARAAEHPLAAGDEPVVLRPSVDQPGFEDVLWIAKDGLRCLGDRDDNGVLATTGCDGPADGSGSEAVVRNGTVVSRSVWVTVPMGTTRAVRYGDAGNTSAMTVHAFARGMVAVATLPAGEDITKVVAWGRDGRVLRLTDRLQAPTFAN